jgi:uncharacterized membrane protein YqiK
MSVPALLFIVLIFLIIASLVIWLIYSRRYQKASQEAAFVRTGYGGQKVVMDGGALVIPTLHEIIQVNMNTIRLEITRSNNHALITKDRMRMDVQAEFYVRVKPTIEDVALAAQTLGRRTMNPDALKELIEGKFVNVLRAVAAELDMDELHQNRREFVKTVGEALSDDLSLNGLELESVSVSELDQTDRKYFNPQNAFDAQGLTLLSEMIQTRAKQRNAIERDAEIAVKRKNLEAERQKLEIEREEEFARLEQQTTIEVRRAEQQTSIIKEQADQARMSKEAELKANQMFEHMEMETERALQQERIAKEQAIRENEIAKEQSIERAEIEKDQQIRATRIESEQQIEQMRITSERELEDARLAKELLLKRSEIAKNKQIEETEIEREQIIREKRIAAEEKVSQARILSEKMVEEEQITKEQATKTIDIARTKAIETAEIDRRKGVELADLERSITVAEKSKEYTAVQAEIDKARALAVKAEEQIVTARQVEVAERQKFIEILETRKKAERDAIILKQAAEAKREASISEAETVNIIAGGEAEKITKIAEAEAEAELIRAKASEKRYRVDAEGARALHEAENVLDPAKSAARIKMATIEHLAEIIRESVKPIESIDGIKIFQVEGLVPPGGSREGLESAGGGGNLADQLVNSALRYRGQAPLVDAILKEIGITGGDIHGLTAPVKPDEEETSKDE